MLAAMINLRYAVVLNDRKWYDASLPYLEKGLEEAEKAGSLAFQVTALINLSHRSLFLGDADRDYSEAIEYANRAAEIEAVKPVIARLKETGWTFGSHTWGHIRLADKPLQTVINDTERWADEVGSLVGPTQILFYPHGGRPDGDDWHQTGERFQYLQSQGFRIFASVGTSSFSYVKPDISAVI